MAASSGFYRRILYTDTTRFSRAEAHQAPARLFLYPPASTTGGSDPSCAVRGRCAQGGLRLRWAGANRPAGGRLKQGANNPRFFYDAQSGPAMVAFNGTKYTYLHNLQGDICGMLDSSGNLVVEYKYDAWGKPVSVRTLTTAYDTLAQLNPFRYRGSGYVYDYEIEVYYIEKRYYDPRIARFINSDNLIADISALANNTQNSFAYCLNNPIVAKDIKVEKTKGVCLELSGALGVRLGGGVQLVCDDKGNVGIALFGEAGAGTPSFSIGLSYVETNAETIWDLEGVGFTIGGSGGVGYLSGGYDIIGGSSRDGSPVIGSQVSISYNIPSPIPVPIEMHGTISATKVISIDELGWFMKVLLRTTLRFIDGNFPVKPMDIYDNSINWD